MIEKTNMGMAHIRNMRPRREVPSLVDLCVTVAIDNVRYLGDVGETDTHLLARILPRCTSEQLMHVENCSIGRDLSPVTDKLWQQFYRKDFGERSFNLVIERMKEKKVAFRWKQLYEAKMKEAETTAVNRMKKLYEKADARKQSRQIRICEKVPPSSKKRSFGSRPGYGLSCAKSNLMKKAKMDFLKSQEVKNLTAMRKNAVQRNYSAAPSKSSGFARKDSASTSKHGKPLNRRF